MTSPAPRSPEQPPRRAAAGLDAWPSRTRWAQAIIDKVPRQVPRGTPEPRGWLVAKFPRLATKLAVLTRFDALGRYLDTGAPVGVETHGEVWSPLEDGAWAPRPPPSIKGASLV